MKKVKAKKDCAYLDGEACSHSKVKSLPKDERKCMMGDFPNLKCSNFKSKKKG